jgi:hypothetical protein
MARLGRFTFDGLKDLQKELEQLYDAREQLFEECARELAARLLAKVKKRTPVGQYPAGSGRVGGTLRRGWTGQSNSSAAAYAGSLPIVRSGDTYSITVINPVEYASYVEYGHRTRNHSGWVAGRFMLTISAEEIQNIAPQVLEAKLKRIMRMMNA